MMREFLSGARRGAAPASNRVMTEAQAGLRWHGWRKVEDEEALRGFIGDGSTGEEGFIWRRSWA